MNAKKTITAAALTAGLVLAGLPAGAGEITVVSWGGAYTKSQVEAYHKPWMAKTGHKIKSVDAPNPAAPCLLYTSPSPRDLSTSRMPSSA